MDSYTPGIVLTSLQLFVNLLAVIAISSISVLIYKLFVICRRLNVEEISDKCLEVVVHRCGVESKQNNDSNLVTNSKSNSNSNGRQSMANKIYDSLRTKWSKTSKTPIESIPESPETRDSILRHEMICRLNRGSIDVSKEGSNGCQSDGCPFNDTIAKIDAIIDQTFDSIIESIDSCNGQTTDKSDED